MHNTSPPWPLTHPRHAAAFFFLSVAHDRRQRREVFPRALRQLAFITDIWICLDCYACGFLKAEQVESLSFYKWRACGWKGSQAFFFFFLVNRVLAQHVLRWSVSLWHFRFSYFGLRVKPVPECSNSEEGTCNMTRTRRNEHRAMLNDDQKCQALYVFLMPRTKAEQWEWFCPFVVCLSRVSSPVGTVTQLSRWKTS